jgi:hypothetical protein
MAAIRSVWKLDFIRPSGARVTMLNYGDGMDAEPTWPTEQQVSSFTALALPWGTNSGDGGAKRSLAWSRHIAADDSEARFVGMITDTALLPFGETGSIELSHVSGATFRFESAVIQAAVPMRRPSRFERSISYRAVCGKTVPVSGIASTPAFPWSWRTEAFGSLTATFGDL